MNDIIKYGGIAVLGYYLYEYYLSTQTPTVVTSVSPTSPNTVTTTPTSLDTTISSTSTSTSTSTPTPKPQAPAYSAISSEYSVPMSNRDALYHLVNGIDVNAKQIPGVVPFISGNVDQWNWYLAQVIGQALPAPEDWGVMAANRNNPLTFGDYIQLASSHGIPGMSGLFSSAEGLGMIMNIGDIFTMTPHRNGIGMMGNWTKANII
jgi:hypothetical protein